MGAAHGKKKGYSLEQQQQQQQQQQQKARVRNGGSKASAQAAQQQQQRPDRKSCPAASCYAPPPDYLQGDDDDDLIKPRKLPNPVKASKSHQELHQELMSSCKRAGSAVQVKPELQRVLESRKRDQMIKQRKQEVEASRKISPLEAELLKRHRKLEELEQQQQQQQQQENLRAPEFVKVKENLRRTSLHSKEEKEDP